MACSRHGKIYSQVSGFLALPRIELKIEKCDYGRREVTENMRMQKDICQDLKMSCPKEKFWRYPTIQLVFI